MSPRLPQKGDFPPSLTLDIIPPPQNQAALNILLLLHGLGDTQTPFAQLGQQLNLPYTACISVRGPSPVPALFTGSEAPSFHWADDIVFDQATGGLDLDAGFTKSEALLKELIEKVLIAKCGFLPRDVVFLGFGQGAMPALLLAARTPSTEYGGIISIGGRLPSSFSTSTAASAKSRTPLVVLGGAKSTQVTRSAVEGLKTSFADFEYVRWAKAEDSMPRSREEMLPVMRFLARRLRSRAGVPADAVEVGR